MFSKFARILIIAVYFLLSCGVAFSQNIQKKIQADPLPSLINSQSGELTEKEMIYMLSLIPVAQLLRTDNSKLLNDLVTTYATKVAAQRAVAKGYLDDPFVAASLWNDRINLLARKEVQEAITEEYDPVGIEQAAKEQYLANKEEYRVDARLKASHIMLRSRRTEEDKTAALQRLQAIKKRVENGDLSFEEAALQYSEERSVDRTKGSLGWFGPGKMVEAFEQAAFGLDVGKISEPIESKYGYHLIYLEDREDSNIAPFDDVKDQIIQQLTQKFRQGIQEEYFHQIKSDPDMRVNKDLIFQIFEDYKRKIKENSD